MRIKHRELADILRHKGKLVEQGREINKKMDKEAEVFLGEHIVAKGLKRDGKNENGEFTFSGTYKTLRDTFDTAGLQEINTLLEINLEKEIKELKKLEHLVNKQNEKVYPIIEKLVIPVLNEFEEVGQINLVKDDEIDVEVYNARDEWEKRYKEKK